jgi:predicted secreted hydrolase
LALLLTACTPYPEPAQKIAVTDALGGEVTEGYARALQPREFTFPLDHGPHPEFRNEWWYLTGNLETPQGRRFGFQVTFFRIALAPNMPPRSSHWATRQLWMGHAALTDVVGSRHLARERFARGALGLAGAQAAPFRVWLEDWQLYGGEPHSPWRLQVASEAFSLGLDLEPQRPPLLQGEKGLSRKSAAPGNASYYYSIPRLAARGTVLLDGQSLPVEGLVWLDREWSTSALESDQAGWDWLSLQLEDGRDLMYYRLRYRDQTQHPASAGSLTKPDGSVMPLGAGDVTMRPSAWWASPTGRRYPIGWEIELAGGERLRIQTPLPDQEMDLTVTYWEGAVDALDPETGTLLGRGYLELAGY